MGFFNTIVKLLDEPSDDVFEKKLNEALNTVERTLGAAVGQVEKTVERLDTSVQQLDKVAQVVADEQPKMAEHKEN